MTPDTELASAIAAELRQRDQVESWRIIEWLKAAIYQRWSRT